eukprot:TRINITY_DN2492_c0_g1_i1.p1 TRINITY_DN2492_c0_g1~~TRINITY_DN2492_c0_g1_i1.p1  ORF type:complete len:293 (-),score=29.76 TRINITY_DN2492_c0_g1_i1:512-1390(-)
MIRSQTKNCWLLFLLGLGVRIEGRQILQEQRETLNTTLCIWESEKGYCKSNPLVKLYLYTNSFEEQKDIGSSRCMIQDNLFDCNTQPGCIYEENLDLNYNYVVDEEDRSLCVLDMSANYEQSSFAEQPNFQASQRPSKECFVPDSYMYTLTDCQTRDVCTDVCGDVDPYFPDTCSIDLNELSSSQYLLFIVNSLQVVTAVANKDLAAMRDLIIRDIAPDASVYCTSVVPQTYPCVVGLISGIDNPECNLLANPGRYFWPSDFYINMFEDSLRCQENTVSTCEDQKVEAVWNP